MIYYCCANDKNIGDYYSMLGLEALVGIKSKYIFMAGKPDVFREQIKILTNKDILIIGGGGLLKDHFEKYWNVLFEEQLKNGFRMANFGIGVCDIKTKSTVLKNEILDTIMATNDALYIRPYIPNRMKYFSEEVFCPSNYYFSSLVTNKKQLDLLLYSEHPKLIGEANNLKIKKVLQNYCKANKLQFQTIDNMDQAAALSYHSAKIIVTTRLHGLILGQALDKKIIPISNDYKIEGYANKLGFIENVIDIDKFSEKYFINKIDNYKDSEYSSKDINASLIRSIKSFKKELGI